MQSISFCRKHNCLKTCFMQRRMRSEFTFCLWEIIPSRPRPWATLSSKLQITSHSHFSRTCRKLQAFAVYSTALIWLCTCQPIDKSDLSKLWKMQTFHLPSLPMSTKAEKTCIFVKAFATTRHLTVCVNAIASIFLQTYFCLFFLYDMLFKLAGWGIAMDSSVQTQFSHSPHLIRTDRTRIPGNVKSVRVNAAAMKSWEIQAR